jgi:hypothetical protein
LNAHIDQCLSVESAPKWMADSKLSRHRIKPRKTKLMVDIYVTAARCTLEELDRRNGRSWATISSLPTRDSDNSEMPDEGKKQRMSPVHTPDTGDVGAVYIDANGTKLRILSKFNEAPSVTHEVAEDIGTRKPWKGGKGSKFLPTKKKKRRAHKHHKYLKIAPQSKNLFSHKAHSFQVHPLMLSVFILIFPILLIYFGISSLTAFFFLFSFFTLETKRNLYTQWFASECKLQS